MKRFRASATVVVLTAFGLLLSQPGNAQNSKPADGKKDGTVPTVTLDPGRCRHTGPYGTCELRVFGENFHLRLTKKQFNALVKAK